ncbi:MAG: hypothetical protein Q7R33_04705 [Nitrosarchaeum sp.]|nr:hypothetical protein [Nitrosarchaeum sp.]
MIVQLADGSLVDLDVVVGISDLYHGVCDSGGNTFIKFDLYITQNNCISFYSGEPIQNKIEIVLELWHVNFNENDIIENYKTLGSTKYHNHLKFIEFWKQYREKLKPQTEQS